MDDGHEESVQIDKGVVPCPAGCDGSSGSVYARYSDGHGYCFRCGHREPPSGTGTAVSLAAHKVPDTLLDATKFPMAWKPNSRKVSSETLRRLGTFSAGWMGKTVGVYPVFNQDGELIAQKLRTPDKEFPVLKTEGFHPGDLVKAKLAFQNVWGDRYDRQVIVTEGEEDAKAVVEVLGDKTAVVSLTAGVGNALANLKANYQWLDRFADIVLWFDDDEPGRKAMQECAPLFKIGKCRLAKTTGFQIDGKTPCKDASDVLVAGRNGDIRTIIYAATAWKPPGIVNAADNPEDVCTPQETSAFAYTWPWPEFDAMFGPILPGKVTYHVAGTGIGKTTAQAHILWHVVEQGGKVAFLSFEGTRRDIKLSLMTVKLGQRLDMEQLDDETMRRLHKECFGSGQVELFDPETAEWSWDAIQKYIWYCAKALGVHVMGIDPLSAIIALMKTSDPVRAIDEASIGLAIGAKETGVHLMISHHLSRPEGTAHEEGAPTSINQVRGSGGVAMFADTVIGHERNQQAEEEQDRTLVQFRSLKNRARSKTGVVCVRQYNYATGQLGPTARPFPKPGSKQGGKEGGPFKAVSDDY